MGKKLVINTTKFLQHCKDMAAAAQSYEDEAAKRRDYEDALMHERERLNWEYLYNACTGECDTDIEDFMEEVEE